MNIADVILSRGKDSSEALRFRTGALTYAELRRQVERVADKLMAHGYLKGDRVGIFSENDPFFVIAYLGIIQAGLTAVPFQTEMSANAFSDIASRTGMKGVFISNRFRDRVQPWAEEQGLGVWEPGDLAGSAEAAGPHRSANVTDRDLAALMFTSGSTGSPKGVMVTHRNIECNTRDIISYMGLGCKDRVMVVLPFYYCFGLSLIHTHLMAGGSLVLNNEFKLFPEAMLGELGQMECTGFSGVPSSYQMLLRRTQFASMEFPKLRWFQQAGGKLPNPFIEEILNAFPLTKFYLMYGQTEATARLSYLPPERLATKLGSIGRGLPSTRLEVLKPDGTPVAPCLDEIGEIVATGDNITLGYWNDPAETAKYFREGKLHTGDMARVDEDGFIFIVERERDLIKSGGNRIGAKEIEDVIAELRDVTEVAVVGAPHDLLGEAIKAFVVPNHPGCIATEEIERYCRRRLPSFKVPEEVILLERMPHNGAGKIHKQELKKILASRESATVQTMDVAV